MVNLVSAYKYTQVIYLVARYVCVELLCHVSSTCSHMSSQGCLIREPCSYMYNNILFEVLLPLYLEKDFTW